MNQLVFRCARYLLPGLLLLGSCIDPYPPAVPASAQSYLIVEGFVNLRGNSVFRLSRTQPLAATSAPAVEARATVSIRDDAGASYPLTENPAGTYTSAALTLSASRRYQVRITTSRSRQYESALVPAKVTPPIGSLGWKADADGVRVLVNSTGIGNDTRFYRWDYVETWQFTSAFFSTVEYSSTAGQVVPRKDDIYTCWRTENSTVIKQANTSGLTQDVVADYPLIRLPYDERLRIKYSVLVQQYAQTLEEYTYWDILGKNTQNLGTLNDPLPTQLTGNVRCLNDASEPVIGYVGAHSVTQQRLFIDYADLPRVNIENTPYLSCYQDTVYLRDAQSIFRQGLYIPYDTWYDRGGKVIAYFASRAYCVDCRQRGTNVKPSFWP